VFASDNDTLAENLRKSGMDLVQTRDGFATIQAAMETRPHAVLLDNLQAGLPSPTVAIWLKLHTDTNDLPIIGLKNQSTGWQEAKIDAELDPDETIEDLASTIKKIVDSSNGGTGHVSIIRADRCEPLDITLDLIEVYRERLLLAGAMIELASLQHDLGDLEYTIKSILEAAGRALDSELISISLLREGTHYTLVRGTKHTRNHLEALDNFSNTELNTLLDKYVEIDNQLVIGRRKLADPSDSDPVVNFIGHPIWSRGEVLGYLTSVTSDSTSEQLYYHGLLSDLTSQIALLLVNSDLITTQEHYVHELSSILRAAVETSSISTITESSSKSFLLQFLLIILELCHTDRGCVILFDEDSGGVSETASLGVEAEVVLGQHGNNNKILSDELIQFPPGEVYTDIIELEGLKLTRVIAPLSAGEQNVGALVVFGKAPNITARIEEAIKALASLAGYHAKNRALHGKIIETRITEDQLKIAREVQLEMLPDKAPDYDGFDINGQSRPAKEVGGDFFDYFPGENCLHIAIGDVCGKSIPASLLMTMTRALFLAAIDASDGPDEVMTMVNSLMIRTITQGKFVTGSLLCLHENNLCYASAGHQPLLVYRASKDEFEEIDAEGIALGIIKDMPFEKVDFVMDKDDIALLYTDGLNEAMNSEREQFGYDNMRAVIRENSRKPSGDIINALTSAVLRHADGTDQHDDTTIVVVKKI